MDDKVNIGDLDTSIEIMQCVITTGTKGQKEYTFQHHSDVWAKVESNVDELVNNSNLQASDVVEVTLYKIPELTTRWKINIAGVGYAITAIDPISRISPFFRISLHIIE